MAAYSALRDCISEGDCDTCEAVPSGDSAGYLINPIAGFGIDMAGPARWVDNCTVELAASVRSLLTCTSYLKTSWATVRLVLRRRRERLDIGLAKSGHCAAVFWTAVQEKLTRSTKSPGIKSTLCTITHDDSINYYYRRIND